MILGNGDQIKVISEGIYYNGYTLVGFTINGKKLPMKLRVDFLDENVIIMMNNERMEVLEGLFPIKRSDVKGHILIARLEDFIEKNWSTLVNTLPDKELAALMRLVGERN